MDILGRRFSIFGGEGTPEPCDVPPEAEAKLQQASSVLDDCKKVIMKLKAKLQKSEQALKAKTIENEALNEALARQNEIIVELYEERRKAKNIDDMESLTGSDTSSDVGDSVSAEASTDEEVTDTLEVRRKQGDAFDRKQREKPIDRCLRCESAELFLLAWKEQWELTRRLDAELAGFLAGEVRVDSKQCLSPDHSRCVEYQIDDGDDYEDDDGDHVELVCEYQQPWQHASHKSTQPPTEPWKMQLLNEWACTVAVS